jgi:hypothetical protein
VGEKNLNKIQTEHRWNNWNELLEGTKFTGARTPKDRSQKGKIIFLNLKNMYRSWKAEEIL